MSTADNYDLVRAAAKFALHRLVGYPTTDEIRDEVRRVRRAYEITDLEASKL